MAEARSLLLVADSSHIVRRIVEMACAGTDIDVVTVDDGPSAVTACLERTPDLVLLETGLAGRDGFEVAQTVKQRPALASVPVLLLARMSEVVDEARASACGCAEVIFKPLRPAHLLERVRFWLSHGTTEPVPPSTVPQPVVPQPFEVSQEPGTVRDVDNTEAFFTRLDAAFKSLDRPVLGSAGPVDRSTASEGDGHDVPTLHELLERLPEDTRRRLGPAPISPERPPADSPAIVDAVVDRVLDRFAERPDLLEEIARRIVAKQASSTS